MKGFKNFVMRGNLVELAIAFIMAAAFADVVKTFTAVLLDLISKVFGKPDFTAFKPGDVPIGAFVTAVIAFLILAAIVYFGIVLPYNQARERFVEPQDAAAPEDIALLTEIRDLLAQRSTQA